VLLLHPSNQQYRRRDDGTPERQHRTRQVPSAYSADRFLALELLFFDEPEDME
jgi:hypothetical protein